MRRTPSSGQLSLACIMHLSVFWVFIVHPPPSSLQRTSYQYEGMQPRTLLPISPLNARAHSSVTQGQADGPAPDPALHRTCGLLRPVQRPVRVRRTLLDAGKGRAACMAGVGMSWWGGCHRFMTSGHVGTCQRSEQTIYVLDAGSMLGACWHLPAV